MNRISSARCIYKLVALLLLIIAVSVSSHKSFAAHINDQDHASCSICAVSSTFGLAIGEAAFELTAPIQVETQELLAPAAPSFEKLSICFHSRAPPCSL